MTSYNFTAYYERSKSANPYYTQNEGLKNATAIIKKLNSENSPIDAEEIKITSFRGGNRSGLINECEFDIEVNSASEAKEEQIQEVLANYFSPYSVKIMIKR